VTAVVAELDLGFGGHRLGVPGHLALFYSGAGDLGQLFDFVRVALDQPREAVVVFGPEGAPATFLKALEESLGHDLDHEVTARKIVVFEGDRDPDAQLSKIMSAVSTCVEDGAAAVRVLALVAWDASKFPAPEDFLWLESRLDPAFGALPVAIVCAYDVTSMPGPGLIYAGIETHRVVSIGGKVVANALAIPADAYLSERLLRLPWLSRDAFALRE
jgi:hypothetical protein